MKHTLTRRNSIFIVIFAIFSILFGASGINTMFNKNNCEQVVAEVSAPVGVDFFAKKITRESSSTIPYDYLDDSTEISPLTNNEFIMLNNAYLEPFKETSNFSVENVKISFKANGTNKITWLVVSAYLNNNPIQTSAVQGATNLSFEQYIDLQNIKDINGTAITNAQGEYRFEFVYFVEDAFGNVEYGNPNNINNPTPIPDYTFSFYLLDENDYSVKLSEGKTDATNNLNPNYNQYNNGTFKNVAGTEPSLMNTEKTQRDIANNIVEKNFYNYQTNKLPTLTFDASRYNVSYTKVLGGTTLKVSSTFKIKENEGKLTFNYFNSLSATIPFKTETIVITKQGENNNYIYELVLKDLGDYVFTINYVLNINNTEFLIANSNNLRKETVNINRIGDVNLNIFGLQPYFNNNGEYAEFKSGDFNSDVTSNNIPSSITSAYSDITTLTIADTNNLCITDQAPVKLSAYADINPTVEQTTWQSQYAYYASGEKTTTPTSTGNYTNNTRFNNNGYYEVVVYYTYTKYETEGVLNAKKIHCQIFAFKISNTAPKVVITNTKGTTDLADDAVLQNGAFANSEIVLNWTTTQSPFFVKPYAKVFKADFGKEFSSTPISTSTSSVNSINATENGHYKVVLYYGANYDSSSTYRFTIDNTSITGIQINYLDLIDNFYQEKGTIQNNATTINTPFVLEYSNKISGANINVSYSFTPLEETGEAISASTFIDADKNYIKNGYKLTGTIENIDYFKNETALNTSLTGTNTRSILNKAGLYIFKLTDSAGNQTTKVVLYDSTKPVVLQSQDQSNFTLSTFTNNVVSEKTTVYFGTHKAIEIDDKTKTLLNGNNALNYSGNFIIVPLTSVEYKTATIYDNLNSQPFEKLSTNSKIINAEEKFYQIKATDASNVVNKNQSSLCSDNIKNVIIEMNLDKSLFMARTFENLDSTDKTFRRLYDNGTSNRKYLSFTFKMNEGTEYEISNLTLKYYPFSFEQNLETNEYNSNFPFSNTAIENDLLSLSQNATSGFVYDKLTNTINLSYNSSLGENITLDGKYVITRKYVNGEEKTYTFVIDRNSIVQNLTDTKIIGEFISLYFGPTQNRKSFSGTQFLIKSINGQTLDLTTNLLPINPRITLSKYPKVISGSKENIVFANETFSALKLNAKLIREYTQGNDKIQEEIKVSNDGALFNFERLYKKGTYILTITDNTGYSTEDSENQTIHSNTLIIKFEIVNNSPIGTFFTSNNQELRNVNSYKESNIKFVWDDPTNQYEAKIDSKNFEVVKINGTTPTTIFKMVDGATTINNTGFSFTSASIALISGLSTTRHSIVFPENASEGNYIVKIHYEGNINDYNYDGVNFYSSNYNFYIDKSVPVYNLTNLLKSDNYLTDDLSAYKDYSTFMNKSSAINFENYAFTTTSDFILSKPSTDAQYDTKSVYIRKYNKYTTTDTNNQFNLQSLVENDEQYSNSQLVRLRFNPLLKDSKNDLIYTKFEYNKPLNSKNSSGEYSYYKGEGYYEIIEIDEAGNQTVYTILVLNNIAFKISTNLEGTENATITSDVNINQAQFSLSNIVANNASETIEDKWFKVSIQDVVKNTTHTLFKTNIETTSLNSFTTITSLIEKINQLITVSSDYEQTGSKFLITFYNKLGENLVITYNTPGEKLMPSVNTTSSGFIITLPLKTATTHLTSFYVYKTVDGAYKDTPESYDSAQVQISPTITEVNGVAKSYSFVSSSGVFKFVFTDNFGRTYEYYQIIGVKDVKELLYSSSTQTAGGITYTAGAVSLHYEPKLYSIVIKKNNVEITSSLINAETLSTITQKDGTYKIELQSSELTLNKNDAFIIEFTSLINGEKSTLKFNYITLLPTYNLLDSAGQNMNNIINNITSKTVYITFDNASLLFPCTLTATRTFVNTTGETIITNLGKVENNSSFANVGEYEIIFTSALGKLSSIKFTIKEISKPNYAVVTNITGQTATTLNPSSVKFIYNYLGVEKTLDQYFTNGAYKIELNPDKNLIAEKIADATLSANTEVYRIRSAEELSKDANGNSIYFYDKLIAINTITLSNNIINSENFYLTYTVDDEEQEQLLSGSNVVTINNPILLHWNQYFEIEGNFITAKYYYNNSFAGATNMGEILLSNSGIYDFYFEDLSGNKHMFGTSSYYRIVVLNEVIFNINNAPSINNSIYNSAVTLEVQQTAQYDYRTLTLSATLNGSAYSPTRNGYVYTFNDYGVYNIVATAQVGGKTIETNFKFAILNQNTARFAHEYTGASGYEITKVMRDGIDVTNTFKTLNKTATLTYLLVNPENGGVGNYTVFVTANFIGARPSQNFSYNFWINNENPILLSSIEAGESTTNDLTLTFNRYLIYSQLGECAIYINGNVYDNINATTSALNEITTKTLTENGTYLVQLKSNTGNTVLSFVISKIEPLNAITIIIIVAVSLIIIILTAIFFKLRTKMKVK